MGSCDKREHHRHRQHGHHCECHSEREHRSGGECGGRCGCRCGGRCGCRCGEHEGCCRDGGHGGFHRRFRSKAEVIAELESYLGELKAEAQAVEERLAELRG
jgi:hypothetical protein